MIVNVYTNVTVSVEPMARGEISSFAHELENPADGKPGWVGWSPLFCFPSIIGVVTGDRIATTRFSLCKLLIILVKILNSKIIEN